MDMRGKRQASSIFGGMGFYIALLVCVIAAGVVGYFALLNEEKEPAPLTDPVVDTVDAVTGGETLPVDESLEEDTQLVLGDEDAEIHPVAAPTETEDPLMPEDEILETGGAEELEIPTTGEVTVPDMTTSAPETVPESTPEQTQVSSKIVLPLAGETVAVFSVDRLMYDATLGDWRTHDGIDIHAEAGTPVVATAAGTVISVGEDERLGVTVQIEHSGGYVTTYASLHPETQISVGDSVEAGEVIGAVGNTSLSEAGLGAHLHFSVTRNGESIDPEAYLPKES